MKQINVRLDQEQQKKMAELADTLRNSEGGVVRFAIDALHHGLVRNNKLGPPQKAGKRRLVTA